MSDEILFTTFESEFLKVKELFIKINKWIITNDIQLLEISENIFFNNKKVRMSRFNIYYIKNPNLKDKYLYGRKIFFDSEINKKFIIKEINKFINSKKDKLQLVNFSNNYYLDKSNLYLRISVFYKVKYIKKK